MAPNGLEQKPRAVIRHPAVLLPGILLVMFADTLARGQSPDNPVASSPTPQSAAPVEGNNSISGLVVKQGKGGLWFAEFDCFYTGAPKVVQVRIELEAGSSPIQRNVTYLAPSLKHGANHLITQITYPGEVTTMGVTAVLARDNAIIASQRIGQIIHWPSFETWILGQQLAFHTPEETLAKAVTLIDTEDERQLAEAKSVLQKLLEENPRLDQAYVELARIAMKTNWNAEGLHQAESLLGSALQIRPDSVNAKVLLGYVYANQQHLARAEALFKDAATSNPPNLWLWTNWGELLVMQGKTDQAIGKYYEAINRRATSDNNDYARKHAYNNLLKLLELRKDFDAMEALYKKRVSDYGPGACYSTAYARFMLQVRGNAQSAIELARGALNQSCEDSDAREVLGMAEYAKWTTTRGSESAEALNQARIFLPVGAKPLYLLATSERTMPAARHLVADGEKIDQKDSEGLTALAHALQNHDLQAARRLLALGADPATPITYADIPVALLPVMNEDIEGIRILRQSGVDYSKLRYRGMSALEAAKRAGNKALIDALGGGGSTL